MLSDGSSGGCPASAPASGPPEHRAQPPCSCLHRALRAGVPDWPGRAGLGFGGVRPAVRPQGARRGSALGQPAVRGLGEAPWPGMVPAGRSPSWSPACCGTRGLRRLGTRPLSLNRGAGGAGPGGPFQLQHLLFCEIHANVAIGTAERNRRSAEPDSTQKREETVTRETQPMTEARSPLPRAGRPAPARTRPTCPPRAHLGGPEALLGGW